MFLFTKDDVILAIREGELDKVLKTEFDKEYALDIISLDRIGSSYMNIPKHYKFCMWIFYHAHDDYMDRLRKMVDTKWPLWTRAERYNTYCTKYNQLFNVVSSLDKHGPGLVPPPSCRPSETDFNEYSAHLRVNQDEEMSFVFETIHS